MKRQRGITLVEVLTALAIAALLATLALPRLQGDNGRAGRLDAVHALTRLQMAQEQYRSAHGLYAAELAPLGGMGNTSPQGRYTISLALEGGESYVATAHARGAQARDPGCATLTLRVRQGFAQTGPDAGCWLR